MPIDVTRIPALEEELWMAQRPAPGGQPPDEGRIAEIENQLRLHRKAAGISTKREKAAKNDEKETADAKPPADDADAKSDKRAENADAQGAPETADA